MLWFGRLVVAMSFATPLALVAVLIVPLLLGGYLWQLRRQRRNRRAILQRRR